MTAANLTIRRAASLLLVAVLALSTLGCRGRRDLTDAIDGGIGRTVTPPTVPTSEFSWSLARNPGRDGTEPASGSSACWLGDSLIVGGGRKLDLYDTGGNFVRSLTDTAGRTGWPVLRAISQVRCAPAGRRLLIADEDKRRLHFLDLDADTAWTRPAPPIPQDVPYVSEVALGAGSIWYDAWLGTRVGPYLEGAAWDSVPLARAWRGAEGRPQALGRTTPYRLPATRRAFNRVSLAAWNDTVWVLTQANAAISAFTNDGETAVPSVFLPVHHRGMAPWIDVGSALPNGLRRNRVVYQPNVGGIAIADSSHFAVLRFRDWDRVDRSTTNGEFKDIWPSSFVEIVDRQGVPRQTFAVPGRARTIAANGRGLVAVVTEQLDGRLRVLSGRLPPLPSTVAVNRDKRDVGRSTVNP